MNAAWRVLQRLFHVPWKQTHQHLDLWDEALGLWETAAAWRALHGFIYAGHFRRHSAGKAGPDIHLG